MGGTAAGLVPRRDCVQAELKQVKQQLASRGEVQQLQGQLASAQAETRDLKERYAKLATQAQEFQQKLNAEVGRSAN